jgi:hypothetical protein
VEWFFNNTTKPGTEAFKWTQAGGLAGLGVITAATYSIANGVSADGLTAFGASGRAAPGGAAQATGQLLQAVRLQPLQMSDLIGGTGYDLTGWNLTATTGVSNNFMFVSNALDPTGQSQAWIAFYICAEIRIPRSDDELLLSLFTRRLTAACSLA